MKYYPNEEMVEKQISISGKATQMFEISIEFMSGKQIQEKQHMVSITKHYSTVVGQCYFFAEKITILIFKNAYLCIQFYPIVIYSLYPIDYIGIRRYNSRRYYSFVQSDNQILSISICRYICSNYKIKIYIYKIRYRYYQYIKFYRLTIKLLQQIDTSSTYIKQYILTIQQFI